jgi:hypothetical protein
MPPQVFLSALTNLGEANALPQRHDGRVQPCQRALRRRRRRVRWKRPGYGVNGGSAACRSPPSRPFRRPTGAAAHATVQATYSFQATGVPGSGIQYFPYPSPGDFEAFVNLNSLGTVDATVGGAGVIMDFSFVDTSSAATPAGGGFYSQTLNGRGSLTILSTSYDQLGSGSTGGGVIYATPGASTATIVLGVNNYGGIGAESGPPSGYLVLQGATPRAPSRWRRPIPASIAAARCPISTSFRWTGRPSTRARPTSRRARTPSQSSQPGRCWCSASPGWGSQAGGGAGGAWRPPKIRSRPRIRRASFFSRRRRGGQAARRKALGLSALCRPRSSAPKSGRRSRARRQS